MLEVIYHFLSREDDTNPEYRQTLLIVLKESNPLFDGGYTYRWFAGKWLQFCYPRCRRIRPAYYYIDDEVVVAAAERASIRTTFNVGENEVHELMPSPCANCR